MQSSFRNAIAGVAVTELAEQFGTPTYVYDAAKITERIDDLRRFDVIRYAQKACSNLAILDLFRKQGVLVDAVSAGEIHRAVLAGFSAAGDPPGIIYSADIFDRDALQLVTQHGIHVNFGSMDMIDQLGQIRSVTEATLRINPGFGHGHSAKANTGGCFSKHGIWHTDVKSAVQRADRYGIRITGLHMHIGSGSDFEHLSQVCGAMEQAAREVGPDVTSISAGGGLPVPYLHGEQFVDLDRYFEQWDQTRQNLQATWGHAVRLEIEPGRYLTAESGYLIAEIRAVKQMGENLFYLLDAGFNTLVRPVLYGAYHPMSVCPRDGRGAQAEARPVIVGGSLCESGDVFTCDASGRVLSRQLPAASPGDLLVIELVGAYGFVMASNYNSKPLPAEVLIAGGKAREIRARQTLDDLVRGESIP